MAEFDEYYKSAIEKLEREIIYLKLRADKRKLSIATLIEENERIKSQYKLELNESKQCIDNLSAELGKIKRKLKRQIK